MAQRTLIIGLGSTGMRTCEEVLKRAEGEYGSLDRVPWLRAIAFETEQQGASYMGRKGLVFQIGIDEETYGTMVSTPAALQAANEFMDWHDPATMSSSDASVNGAGNSRMIGRATFLHPDSFAVFDEEVNAALQDLSPESMTSQAAREARGRLPDGTDPEVALTGGIRIFVVGTLTGGTCSGSFIDVGYYLRTLPGVTATVIGMFGIPHPSLQVQKGATRKANAYAALRELNHFHQDGVQYRAKFPTRQSATTPTKGTRPFHSVFICQPRGGQGGSEQLITSSLAQFLFLSAVGNLGATVAGDMINPATVYAQFRDGAGRVTSFNTLGVSVIEFPAVHVLRGCAVRLANEAITKWLSNLPPEPGPCTQIIRNVLKLEHALVSVELRRPPPNTDPFEVRTTQVVAIGSQGAREGEVSALATSEATLEAGFRHDRSGDQKIPSGIFKDTIAANGEAMIANRSEIVKEYLADSIRDAERGPLWVQKFVEALRKHLVEWRSSVTAGPDAKGASAEVALHRAGMDDATVRLNDTVRSGLIKGLLIYKRTALNKGADDYQDSGSAYWDARLQEACEPAIRRLCNSLIELCDLTIGRTSDTLYGMERWANDLQAQLAAIHKTIDSTAPQVNGEALFVANQTVGREYERLLSPLRHRGKEDAGIPEAYTGADYAIRRLIRSWDWVGKQLLAKELTSEFDTPQSDDRMNKPKPVEVAELEALVDLAKPFFRDILNVKAVQRVPESELASKTRSVFDMSAPFLAINDAHMNRTKPTGKDDPRLSRLAFYKGASTARGAPNTPEGIVFKSVTKDVRHFVDIDEPHRIVFAQARAIFSLVSIDGLDPLGDSGFRDDYELESKNRQVHSRVGSVRWKALDNQPEVQNAPLLVAQFLAGVALGYIQGAGKTPFTLVYESMRPGGKSGTLSLSHELEDVAYMLGNNLDARFTLQKRLETVGSMNELLLAFEALINNVGKYELTYGGRNVDTELAEKLLRPYVATVPNLSESWKEQYAGAPSLDDYLYDTADNVNPDIKRAGDPLHPFPGYYCPMCDAFLAPKDQGDQVPANCKGCSTPLLAS